MNLEKSLESLVKDFKNKEENNSNEKFRDSHELINVWVPKGYKEKWDALQTRTNFAFGKLMKKVFMLVIDKSF